MTRPFLVKDIALQAGASVATVDRVLNQRGGVRSHTVRRIENAVALFATGAAVVGGGGA